MTNPPLPPPPWGPQQPTTPPPPFAPSPPPADPPLNAPPPPPGSSGSRNIKIGGREITPKALVIGGCVAFFLCCGGLGTLGAIVGPTTTTTVAAAPLTTKPEPESTKPATTAPPTAPKPTVPPTTAAPTTKAPSWPNVALDNRTVEARLKDQHLQPRSVQVNGGLITVRYKPDSVWDENSMVQHAGEDGMNTARALFNNPAVQAVRTEMLADFTDQYGNSAEEIAVWSMMRRETADKVNWDGIKSRVQADGSDWLCISDSRGAHPGVRARVETQHCLT